jgi:type VI protein secretion system component VasK
VLPFEQVLADRYPFSAGHNVRDARISDVEKFFAPGTGTLWQFYNESLKNDIEHPSGTSTFRLREEATIKYRPELTEFLKRAWEITELLFKEGSGKMGINYAIRIRPSPPFQKIIFRSGQTSAVYFNAREAWHDVTWPARGAIFELTERAGTAYVGHTDVEWGLFHLLDEANRLDRQADAEEYLHASWVTATGGSVNADFKPATLARPFKRLVVPSLVVPGTAACRDDRGVPRRDAGNDQGSEQ